MIFFKTFTDWITMDNKREWKRKYDHTRDDTRHIEQLKEYYRRKKQWRVNIEGTIDDNVIRDLHLDVQQEEIEPGMQTYYR